MTKVLALRKQVADECANNDDRPHSLNSNSIRFFDVPTLNLEANAYHELGNVESHQQQPRAIASLTDTEVEKCLKKSLVLHHPCHNQSVERHVKLVAEASAQVAGFDRQDGVIRQKIKSRELMKTFDTKKQFK